MNLLVLTLCCSTALAQGNLPDPNAVVLRVGPFASSLGEFYNEFRRAAMSDTTTLTPDLTGAERFLERYIDLLAVQTVALPDTAILDPQRKIYLEDAVNQVYQDALDAERLPRYLGIDDALLREVYERNKTELRLAVIKVPTRSDLETVRAELARGSAFASVAAQMSKDPNSADRGGDLGWVQAKVFPIEMQRVIWNLPAGGESQPIEEPSFHAIYRVVEMRPLAGFGSFETEQESLRRAIVQTRLGAAGTEMHDDLMAAYHFRVDPDAAEWMRAFLQKETASIRRGYDPAKDKPAPQSIDDVEKPFWTEAPLKGADAARPVAYVDGDTLPAIEVIDQLIFSPSMTWATFEKASDVVELCDEALYQRVKVMEAKRLGYSKRPEIQRRILDKKRRVIWPFYRAVKIFPAITPTEAELRAAYEQRRSSYNLPERRRFVLINTPTLDLARRAADGFRRGLVPSTVVREIGSPELNFLVTPDTTSGWSIFGQHPAIDTALFGLKEGQVSEPIPDGNGYSVLRLERISPAHTMSFEEVQDGISRGLMAQREKAYLADLAKKTRPGLQVWADRAMIARMPIDPSKFQRDPRPR